MTEHAREAPVVRIVRRLLFVTLALGILASEAELLLIGHTESLWQLIPIVLLGVAVLTLVAGVVVRRGWTIRALQLVMVLFLVAGLLGVFLHYQGNEEFELEMYPDLAGTDLAWETLTGATPVLAPGSLIHIGLVGIAYCFRHPATAVQHSD